MIQRLNAMPMRTESSLGLVPKVSVVVAVHDYRQKTDRHFDQVFRSVKHVAGKGQRIPWLKPVRIATMPIGNLSVQHVDELGPFMLEGRKGFALIVHRDEERFEQLPGP